ncbi:hypothetical protein FB566_0537 [Stackebrandtia endophytica]|uniref:Uncharacterized protein n=1 Tax=Stackebrandtia endophytica TaxID=1496996 RepID=A0A543AR91_9ACTN|nr:hypothetical protein [Stackebrandtia endophytica]TQL75045.1 hypothetical protein FB566_0537 [Stackebrandtia endophytica]
MDIEEQLALAAETDELAAHMEETLPPARQRFLDMLPQFMEIRETGTPRQIGEVNQLLPRVLSMLDYIDSCMEHTRMVRVDMALIRLRLAPPGHDPITE